MWQAAALHFKILQILFRVDIQVSLSFKTWLLGDWHGVEEHLTQVSGRLRLLSHAIILINHMLDRIFAMSGRLGPLEWLPRLAGLLLLFRVKDCTHRDMLTWTRLEIHQQTVPHLLMLTHRYALHVESLNGARLVHWSRSVQGNDRRADAHRWPLLLQADSQCSLPTSADRPLRHECLLVRTANPVIVAIGLFFSIIRHLWLIHLIMDLQSDTLLALRDHVRVLTILTARTRRPHPVALAAALDLASSRSLSLRSLRHSSSILQAGPTDNVLLARCDIDDRLHAVDGVQ